MHLVSRVLVGLCENVPSRMTWSETDRGTGVYFTSTHGLHPILGILKSTHTPMKAVLEYRHNVQTPLWSKRGLDIPADGMFWSFQV